MAIPAERASAALAASACGASKLRIRSGTHQRHQVDPHDQLTMPLIAADGSTGNVVDLTVDDDKTWSAIWRRKTGTRLRCRSCGHPVHAKLSQGGLRFFAHSPGASDCPTVGESARHLELKAVFARAFRSVGWTAELEVAGPNWRADVLATGPDGAPVAVEVQCSGITPDAVAERTARHSSAGVFTLWIVPRPPPLWATRRTVVSVTWDNRVVDAVLTAAADGRPQMAGPASIDRFVQRFAERRIMPTADPDDLWSWELPGRYPLHALQLDGCVDAFLQREGVRRAEAQAERAASEQRRRDQQAINDAQRERDAGPMAASLHAFRRWLATRDDSKCWFGAGLTHDPEAAVAATWDPEFGIVIVIGLIRPTWVLAVAEPRVRRSNTDPRVLAWTTGADPRTDTTRYRDTLDPSSPFPQGVNLKPYEAKRRRRPR